MSCAGGAPLSEREKGKMVALSVTPAEFDGQGSRGHDSELVAMSAGNVELAKGIEPPTCGLQIRVRAI